MFENLISSPIVRELYATFVFTHGCLLLGIVSIFPACLIPQLKQEGYGLDTFTESFLGTIPFFTGCIGAFFSAVLIGKAGRKRIFQILLLWFGIGMSIVAASPNFFLLCFGFIMTSIILSFVLSLVTTYISETCRKENRGVLISGSYVFVATGNAIVYLLNGFLSWRIIAAIAVAICISGLLQCFVIPETKYWHLLNMDEEKAVASLLWFEPNLNPSELQQKLHSVSQSINNDPNAKVGHFRQLIMNLRYKKYLMPVLLGLVLTFLRSGNGRVIFSIHVLDIFKRLEVPYNPVKLGTIFGIVEMIGSAAVLFLIYKCNRKSVIYVASGIMIVSMFVIIVYKFLINENIEIIPKWLAAICVYAYSLISMAALNSSLSVILSEIQHAYYRAEITSLNSGTNFLFLSVYQFLFPYMEKMFPIEYIMIFFLTNAILTVITIFVFFPETSKFEFFENTKKKESGKYGATQNV